MSQRTRYVNKQLVYHLSTSLIKKLDSIGIDYIDQYASNIESDLSARGEHRLAQQLLDELATIGPGEPVKCAYDDCKVWVSFGARDHTGKVYCREHEYLA